MSKISIDINGTDFDKKKASAIKLYEKEYSENENKSMKFDDVNWDLDNVEFENGKIMLCGQVGSNGDFGWATVEFDMDLDLAAEVVDFYMKKLGKIKTVLEANK